jgi:hypothetical protein
MIAGQTFDFGQIAIDFDLDLSNLHFQPGCIRELPLKL